MRITEVNIQGFRSLKKVTWKPGSLNLIIGPNGSGKSNLLKALEMLSASSRGRLSEQVARQGGMESLAWDSQPASTLKFALAFERQETDLVDRSWSYELQLQRLGSSSSYRVEREALAYQPENPKLPNYARTVFDRKSSAAAIAPKEALLQPDEGTQQQMKIYPMENFPLANDAETILAAAASPFTNRLEISEIQKSIAGWGIYQEFLTHQEAPVRRSPVARRETSVSADGSNLIQVLHTLYTGDRQFKQDLDLAMHAAFDNEFEEIIFPPDADQRIQLRVRWKGLKQAQSAADLSDGTLRFLYLAAILANPTPPSLIAIDEPENGLHPSMLPIIAEYARNASIRTQVIISTHSAELLDAFNEYEPTVTTTKWADGQTQLAILSGKTFAYWLKEYTLGKLYRSGELEELS